MNVLESIKQDYQRFPFDQTYSLYAKDVYFKDPLTEFRGCDRYQKMIGFIATWFRDVKLDLYEIRQDNDRIDTKWTLNWTTPLPWKPRIAIPGRSELILDEQQLIVSHIDYWDCSPLAVLKQHFFPNREIPRHNKKYK